MAREKTTMLLLFITGLYIKCQKSISSYILNAVDTIRRDETKSLLQGKREMKREKKGRNTEIFRKTEMCIILVLAKKKNQSFTSFARLLALRRNVIVIQGKR